MSFWLEFNDNGQKREFTFQSQQVSIGRVKAADFVLDHPTVSRQHAVIQMTPGGPRLLVISQGGLTAVNGRQVYGEVALHDGATINFGQLTFVFRCVEEQTTTAFTPPQVESHFPDSISGGIQSWDDIAAGAVEEEEDYQATNFQRLQEAQKRANQQSKGNSPLLLIAAVLLGGGMLAYAYSGNDTPPPPIDIPPQVREITWGPGDIQCSVPADCQQKAIDSYEFASKTFEEKDVAVDNLYIAYQAMDKAELLLEKGGITEPIPQLHGLSEKRDQALQLMNEKHQQFQISFHHYQKHKMYEQMAETLDANKAYFPDKRHKKNYWSVSQERKMRDVGIYPNRI